MNTTKIFTPAILLRLEGASVFLLTLLLYAQHGGNWLMYILLLFIPDLSALGYLINTHIGAYVYNLIHTYVLPIALLAISLLISNPLLLLFALIWLSHIGLDRLLGFGLKYPTIFKDTHLNRVG
ncbi:DUF4260 domain-containing protein [Dictyobacter alpinus]|uniref:DUF4260 domain-containing protein n=1 Tax=Dictyobacter alpinus TaxID=2014873 RepID=UPI000F8230AD|nr:DUF4260 domain-containing protein [Dictyobacter alpinus]